MEPAVLLIDGLRPNLFCCLGEKGVGSSTAKPLHYKGTYFHRIIKGFMAQVCFLFFIANS